MREVRVQGLTTRFAKGPRLLRPEDLGPTPVRAERVQRVATARVVCADYTALKFDFPSLAACKTTDEVDRWLCEQAVIAEPHLDASEVHTAVPISGEPVSAYRPRRYGRAVVLDTGVGLLDIKGAGVAPDRRPMRTAYGTGLLPLVDALEGFAKRMLVDRCLAALGSRIMTLPEYAVLDLGFDIRGDGERLQPAALCLRRAHRRSPRSDLPAYGSVQQRACFETEMLLRHFGITSTDGPRLRIEADGGGLRVDQGPTTAGIGEGEIERLVDALGVELPFTAERVNVQTTREVELAPTRTQLVDFEHYQVRDGFDVAVQSLVCDRPMCWGGVLLPNDPAFVRPARIHPHLRAWWMPEHGSHGDTAAHVRFQALAHRFRAGLADRQEVENLCLQTVNFEPSLAEVVDPRDGQAELGVGRGARQVCSKG